MNWQAEKCWISLLCLRWALRASGPLEESWVWGARWLCCVTQQIFFPAWFISPSCSSITSTVVLSLDLHTVVNTHAHSHTDTLPVLTGRPPHTGVASCWLSVCAQSQAAQHTGTGRGVTLLKVPYSTPFSGHYFSFQTPVQHPRSPEKQHI